MLVTTDAKQMKCVLDMGRLRIISVAIGTPALLHPGMMAQAAFGTPLMMGRVIKADRTELPLAREGHDIRSIIRKNLRTNENQKDTEQNRNDSIHAKPQTDTLELPKTYVETTSYQFPFSASTTLRSKEPHLTRPGGANLCNN